MKQDFGKFKDSLKEDPFQGVDLGGGLRKIRMAIDSKRKGKAGGARVITYTTLVDENTGEVWLIGYVFIDTLRRIPAKILLAKMPAGFCVIIL